MPFFFKSNPRSCYFKVSSLSNCNIFIYSIVEFMIILRVSIDQGASYTSIFSFLFYYLSICMFFTGLILLVSIIGILLYACGQNRTIPFKVHILQAFYGLDNILMLFAAYYVTSYSSADEKLK